MNENQNQNQKKSQSEGMDVTRESSQEQDEKVYVTIEALQQLVATEVTLPLFARCGETENSDEQIGEVTDLALVEDTLYGKAVVMEESLRQALNNDRYDAKEVVLTICAVPEERLFTAYEKMRHEREIQQMFQVITEYWNTLGCACQVYLVELAKAIRGIEASARAVVDDLTETSEYDSFQEALELIAVETQEVAVYLDRNVAQERFFSASRKEKYKMPSASRRCPQRQRGYHRSQYHRRQPFCHLRALRGMK